MGLSRSAWGSGGTAPNSHWLCASQGARLSLTSPKGDSTHHFAQIIVALTRISLCRLFDYLGVGQCLEPCDRGCAGAIDRSSCSKPGSRIFNVPLTLQESRDSPLRFASFQLCLHTSSSCSNQRRQSRSYLGMIFSGNYYRLGSLSSR